MGRLSSDAAAYVRRLFDEGDRVALLAVRRQGSGGIIQRFPTAQEAASVKYLAWCRHLNASGYDVYLGTNPIVGARRRREKQDIAEVRRLQLDLDEHGPEGLKRLLADVAAGRAPRPAGIMFTSRRRYQVLWDARRGTWAPAAAESVMRQLADRYGGDRAVADVARVMRVPGLRNKKAGRAERIDGRSLADRRDAAHRAGDLERAAALSREPNVHLGPQGLKGVSGEAPSRSPRLAQADDVDQRNDRLAQDRAAADEQLAAKQAQISWLEREVQRIAQVIREVMERIAARAREPEQERPRGRGEDWGRSR